MQSLDLKSQKELIDYEIEAKRKAKNKDLAEWVAAAFLAVLFFIVLASIIASI